MYKQQFKIFAFLATFCASCLFGVDGFSLSATFPRQRRSEAPLQMSQNLENENKNRRALIGSVLGSSSATFLLPLVAKAGIDPNQLRTLPVEGDVSGTQQRLREIDAVQRPPSDLTNVPFEELPSGVSYREYREGKGEAGTRRADRSVFLLVSAILLAFLPFPCVF